MATKKKSAKKVQDPDVIQDGSIWWASGKPGFASPTHYYSSVLVLAVMGDWCKLSVAIGGNSSGMMTVRLSDVIKVKDHLFTLEK